MYDVSLSLWIAVPVASVILAWHIMTNRQPKQPKDRSNNNHDNL